MYIGLYVQYLFLWTVLMELKFTRQIKKKTLIWNFIKNRPVETELSPADILTDTTKLIVAFRNIVN